MEEKEIESWGCLGSNFNLIFEINLWQIAKRHHQVPSIMLRITLT